MLLFNDCLTAGCPEGYKDFFAKELTHTPENKDTIDQAREQDMVPTRLAYTVYLIGRKLKGSGAIHIALEYSDTAKHTISAAPEHKKLFSETNRPSDMYDHNFTIDIVTPPAGMSHSAYFKALQRADSAYCDCVDYGAFPSHTGSYNSNSYIHGLLNATGGATAVDLNQYVGGEKPLPDKYFGK